MIVAYALSFIVGGCIGFLTCALLVASKKEEQDMIEECRSWSKETAEQLQRMVVDLKRERAKRDEKEEQ